MIRSKHSFESQDLGGFRKAAERLNLSQPAISARISNLEQELRVTLFERGKGEPVLTKHGALLLSYAEQNLFVEEEIKQRVVDPSETEGLFRIGASEIIAHGWPPVNCNTIWRSFLSDKHWISCGFANASESPARLSASASAIQAIQCCQHWAKIFISERTFQNIGCSETAHSPKK